MADIPFLWSSGGRKEAMALLDVLWLEGTDKHRERITDAILAGPPADLLARIGEDDRPKSRDRRIFDRLKGLERLGAPPLGERLQAEVERLAIAYPQWIAPEGERAHFAAWSEVRLGPDSDYSVDDLAQKTTAELVELLVTPTDLREGLLEAWKELGEAEPEKAVVVLESLAARDNPVPTDAWEYGLWGVRSTAKDASLRQRVLDAVEQIPDALLNHPEVARVSTDYLHAAAASSPSPTSDPSVWRLFDRTKIAVSLDETNVQHEDQDAVTHAINSSMGILAQAYFALLFARSLKVSSKIPSDLRDRAERLMTPGSAIHRPARVIAASRLSYLFAVDPDWTKAWLIPSFDWAASEGEASAVWQGYAWQPRIDEKLWPVIRPYFLQVFQDGHLETIGEMAKSLVQLLMLVVLDIEKNGIPNDVVRAALRAMTDRHRAEALSWITHFLAQPEEPEKEGDTTGTAKTADSIWSRRVAPWIANIWPPEPGIQSGSTSEHFAQIAIATDTRFPEAVEAIIPHLVRTNAYYELDRLRHSAHPDNHPRAVIRLIDALAERLTLSYDTRDLSNILHRVRAADPTIVNVGAFTEFSNIVMANPPAT
jgi:hypothetical protein